MDVWISSKVSLRIHRLRKGSIGTHNAMRHCQSLVPVKTKDCGRSTREDLGSVMVLLRERNPEHSKYAYWPPPGIAGYMCALERTVRGSRDTPRLDP